MPSWYGWQLSRTAVGSINELVQFVRGCCAQNTPSSSLSVSSCLRCWGYNMNSPKGLRIPSSPKKTILVLILNLIATSNALALHKPHRPICIVRNRTQLLFCGEYVGCCGCSHLLLILCLHAFPSPFPALPLAIWYIVWRQLGPTKSKILFQA